MAAGYLAGGFTSTSAASAPPAAPAELLAGNHVAEKHVVFVTGDDEYASEVSMPMIGSILDRRPGFRVTTLRSVDEQGKPDPHGQSIPGLEALRDADLAVFFLRFRTLPPDQVKAIEEYLASGRPVVGLRTSSHAFRYREGPYQRLDNGFGDEVLGQRWIAHYGHNTRSEAAVVPGAAPHPVLRGVPARFPLSSWLYVTDTKDRPLPRDCRLLLFGSPVGAAEERLSRFGPTQPLAWTRTLVKKGGKQRVFYTTLGHPHDFKHEPSRRLLLNAIYWALGAEASIPAAGVDAPLPSGYNPPDPK